MDRRIAAIFVADMVGSTRLMERDERDVITRHKAHLSEVFEPEFAARRGRVIKGTGDGLIGVFDSVVDALEAAMAIQNAMVAREEKGDRQIAYRIAVHLGDVMFDEDDVYGDGVNIAARLEGEAEPGGIVVSGAARDMLKDQVDVVYGALGDLAVKGVSEPVRAFAVGGEGRKPDTRSFGLFAAAALLTLALIGGGWWWSAQPDFMPADPAKMAYRLPQTPTLAIAGFENLKSGAEDDYLGRSLTEALVVKLTGSPTLTVIQAMDMMNDQSGSVAQIAEASSARYVLSGSYLLAGDSLQVTAKLADALDGRQLWAETYQRPDTSDAFFDIQDAITDNVAASVNIQLTAGDLFQAYIIEGASLEEILISVEAGDAFQRWDASGNATAMQIYKSLLNSHPDGAPANTLVAWAWWQQAVIGLAPPQEVLPKAASLASRALELDPTFAGAYAVLTWVALPSGDYEKAAEYIDQHIKFSNGNAAPSITGALLAIDRPQEAERLARKIMREQPRHHDFVPRNLALSLMQQGQFDEASDILRGIVASETRDARLKVQASTDLVVLAKLAKDQDGFDDAANKLREIAPNLTISQIAPAIFDRSGVWKATYLDAVREAGVPEG